ncbi:MAG: permease [Thermoanaerobacterales bacterium]|nr:permease [Bacillota bacterium]MDI6908073.1 permease [Thermoanaerobacterales bacterium]
MFELNSLVETARFFGIIFGELVLLFIGISFLVGLLQEFIPPERIKSILERQRRGVGNFIGAALGAVTPFCSCSTIPILIGLLNGGAPFGTAMSFLIASPLLNPVIIMLLLALLGLKVTAMYSVITFAGSVATGVLWERLGLAADFKGAGQPAPASCCGEAQLISLGAPQDLRAKLRRSLQGAMDLFRQVFWYLLLGAAIGALIYGFVPERLVVWAAGPQNPLAIPVAALIGIPMYLRAETIIPISAVLIGKGISLGAVVALIIGGAGASIPEVLLLASIFRRRLVVAFVTTVLTVAVAAGYLVELIL